MARFVDRVKETTITNGTGTITLAGAATNFQAFQSVFAVGDRIQYAVVDNVANSWEVGLGTLSGVTSLSRDVVYASSNANALVSFAANVKDVFCTIAAPTANAASRGKIAAAALGQQLL